MAEPVARLFLYASYRDCPAAITWLEAVGFELVRRQDGADGTVEHAELRLGEAVVMLATADADYVDPPLRGRSTGGGPYLQVDEVDEIHARALAAGATEVFAPERTEWGTARSRVLDPEGHEWSFGTYAPGQAW